MKKFVCSSGKIYSNKISCSSRYFGKLCPTRMSFNESATPIPKMTYEEHYKKNHEIIWNMEKLPPRPQPPYTDTKPLENIDLVTHVPPKTLSEKIAYHGMEFIKKVVNSFFRDRYGHHAVTLETVAAVPGFIAGFHRHFRSLRRMQRDFGFICHLLEEAENERMHLLIWMQYCKPNFLERILVLFAQILFTPFYAAIYILSPSTAHKMVGYLEEEAVVQYSQFLQAIDQGKIANVKAPEVALKYYNLHPDSTLRDVVICVRADEAHHSASNHANSEKLKRHGIFCTENAKKEEMYRA